MIQRTQKMIIIHPPNSWSHSRIISYLELNKLNDISLDKIGYIAVDSYAICSDTIELITNELNACSALAISTQNKVFLAHFPRNRNDFIPLIYEAFQKEFDLEKFDDQVEIKIWLGSTSDKCPHDENSSIEAILRLLFKLKLINKIIEKLQQYIKDNIDFLYNKEEEIFTAPLSQLMDKSTFNLSKLLTIRTITEDQIEPIARLIDENKNLFERSPNCIIEKMIKFQQFASTREVGNSNKILSATQQLK